MNLIKNKWTTKDYQNFIKYLQSIKDTKYKNFQTKIINNNSINIIGIKTPKLKEIAKTIYKGNYKDFLGQTTFKYYEESIIYALIISNIKTLNNDLIKYIDIYKTKIDNWASCDIFCSNLKIVKKNKEYFYNYIKENLNYNNEYIKRMCFVLLLNYYIDKNYLNDIFTYTNTYCNSTYYINMSIAWLISICYIKYKEITINYLLNNKLDNFTFNKTISKICDSHQISKEEKLYLKTLKRKTVSEN